MLAIIDYGAGNMRSVERAVRHVGADYQITIDPAVIAAADGVVLPGVGAARATMTGLSSRDLEQPVRAAIASGRPFLGICMGLQALFTGSEEDGGTDCLDLYPGAIRRFPDGLHIPHMGWNQVTPRRDAPILEGIAPGTNFYFVHSYYAGPPDADFCGATTEYGVPFLSVLHDGNVFGTQFHPEKSGRPGLRIYANFARLCGEAVDPDAL